ncbi:MAG: S8 family serine peptidase [Flavobacteriaceae bacterium]|nr:S8 family serine peptidase [Flavobacteriaceae bacterium]
MKNLITFILLLSITAVTFSQGIPARQEANLDQVYSQYNLDGENVLIVILDRGIDYRHPDFLDENGNTRLAYVFDMIDQSGAGDPDNPYGVGTIFDQAEIDAALDNNDPPLSNDRYGHGTATTGIAAGNGSGTASGDFQGVAPKATLISIKITHDPFPPFGSEPGQAGFFNPAYIPIALEFAADKIAELGLPSVTLMNIGSIGGPTDGTSSICRAIDDFVALGHPFVCGVGDDGGNDNHASGSIDLNETIEIEVEKAEAGFLRFDLWYSEDDRFTVSIERPNGTVEGPFTAPGNAGAAADTNLGDIGIFHRGADVEFYDATSHRRELLIDFTGDTGTYKVILQGAQINDGGFHAVLNPSTYYNNNRFGNFVTFGTSINDYASANSLITPGDYVVKNDWIDIDGIPRDITGQGEEGELWIGSSSGPTQDGRRGIDFVASGEVCHAAYADNTYYESFSFNVLQNSNGLYGIQNAVSAAAPLSTGVIALMLQVNPDLSPQLIRQILRNTSREDSFTGTTPNPTWGYGKLDALAAVNQAFVSLGIVENQLKTAQLFPNPTNGSFTIQLSEAIDEIELSVVNMLGQIIEQKKFRNTKVIEQNLNAPNGLYFVQISANHQANQSFKLIKQ